VPFKSQLQKDTLTHLVKLLCRGEAHCMCVCVLFLFLLLDLLRNAVLHVMVVVLVVVFD